MTPQLMQLIEETFEYGMTNVHTAFPAVVKSYDAETRRAEVQPSLKRKMSNGEFMDLPIIVDVPVLYFGTAKAGIHIPLEEGDEVLTHTGEYHKVLTKLCYIHHHEKITINGIECTPEHKFLVINKKDKEKVNENNFMEYATWIEAYQLNPDTQLIVKIN